MKHFGAHVAQFEIGDGHNFVYLVFDPTQKSAVIIDPQAELDEPLAFLKEHQLTLHSILLTHSHHDHTAGIPGLLKLFPELRVGVQAGDRGRLRGLAPKEAVFELYDGEKIPLGGTGNSTAPGGAAARGPAAAAASSSLAFEMLHTPGHSAGACCYLLRPPGEAPVLFSGDTVFVRACGRTDLPTGSDEELFASFQRLSQLPPETLILPGHHYTPEFSTTLAEELRTNPAFLARTLEEFKRIP